MDYIAVEVANFDRAFPTFSKPETVGEYGVDRERRLRLGRSDAKFLHVRPLDTKKTHFDLNIGFEMFEEKEGEEKLKVLEEWICTHAPPGADLKKALHEADIVCWRGLLTRIAATPYCPNDSWMLVAHRLQQVVFLCEIETDDQKRRKQNMSARDKMMTYWGFKFEQHMTLDSREMEEPNTSKAVTCREEFAVVVKSSIQSERGPIRLLYAGEVDAVDRNGDWVELKTQRRALEGGFWRQKSLKWWLQSFLVGIKNLVVGFRDDNGIVHSVDTVRVDALPKKGEWQANACMNFLVAVLTRLIQVEQRQPILVEFVPSQRRITFVAAPNSPQFRVLDDGFCERFSS